MEHMVQLVQKPIKKTKNDAALVVFTSKIHPKKHQIGLKIANFRLKNAHF
jgi:hypothetical protein